MTIRQSEEKDIPRLIELSFLFDYSPFTIDKKFRALSPDFYPTFADDMIRKKSSVNIVAEGDEGIIGYITVGMNEALSKAIGKKIGNIYLLSVEPTYRDKGIGRFLVEKGCGVLYTYGADLVTVGTDLYNIPAIHVYESNGFRSAMFWHIYRYYPDTPRDPTLVSDKIDLISMHGLNQYLPYLERPVSLLRDRKISQERLMGYISEQFLKKSIGENETVLEYRDNGRSMGMIHLSIDKLSMSTLNVSTPVYKIADLIVMDENTGMEIGEKLLEDIQNRMGEYLMLEMWVEPSQTRLIESLEKTGFHLCYSGVSLHRWKRESL
ncbi:MAG: GNAT family N-acetyltransferase [Brevinematales bacterium]|nr:GNAT family N-acetyltransferase [Brevinematales bacterium]